MVRELDNRVGDWAGQEPLVQRILLAALSEFPWQFMYVLSGGERRITNTFHSLAEEDEADLVFGILALAQLFTLDVGGTFGEIAELAHKLGRDKRVGPSGSRDLIRTSSSHRSSGPAANPAPPDRRPGTACPLQGQSEPKLGRPHCFAPDGASRTSGFSPRQALDASLCRPLRPPPAQRKALAS